MTDERIKAEYDPSNLDAPTLAAVELRDVVKSYGKKRVLDSVSYRLEPGSVFALLGENGAGKTTTIKMLLGETKPDSGKINVFQLSPEKHAREIRERTGYVPEQPVLYGYMTVAQMGKFAAAFYPEGYMAEYAKRCEEFGLSPNDRIKNLSKGGRAKTSLALALAGDPDLLILDEPTSGLDALVRRQFLANIADLAAAGKTVFSPAIRPRRWSESRIASRSCETGRSSSTKRSTNSRRRRPSSTPRSSGKPKSPSIPSLTRSSREGLSRRFDTGRDGGRSVGGSFPTATSASSSRSGKN